MNFVDSFYKALRNKENFDMMVCVLIGDNLNNNYDYPQNVDKLWISFFNNVEKFVHNRCVMWIIFFYPYLYNYPQIDRHVLR
jgi:hypothetical protein